MMRYGEVVWALSTDLVTEEKRSKVPHIYVILLMMIGLAAVLTHIIPAGEYARVTDDSGAEILQDGTYSQISSSPASFVDFMFAVPDGLIDTADIVIGIIIIGGMFAVIEKAGLIELAVSRLAHVFEDKGLWIIPTLMVPFALFTAFTDQIELALVYLPAILPLILRLGFDRITATGIVLVSTVVGFGLGLTSPANVGTAQRIAQLPLYSGIGYRALLLAIFLFVGIVFVWRHASRVRFNPDISSKYGTANAMTESTAVSLTIPKASRRQIAASIVLLVAFAFLIYSLLAFGWFFRELAGLYLIIGAVVGLVAGLRPSEIAESFNEGFQKILLGALVVGFARGVAVVLEDGSIMDTIIFGAAQLAQMVPDSLTAVMMLVVQAGLNFLIPSGSGQAMVTMPIMSGLADLSGVSRQTAVLAFLMGDGFSNIFYPTSGYFMAVLAISGLRWEKWIRYIWPLIAIWYGLGAVAVILAGLFNY